MPYLSLLAVDNGQVIGQILFTKAQIAEAKDVVSAMILAPLAPVHLGHGRV